MKGRPGGVAQFNKNSNMPNFQNKKAFITGSSRGIGQSIALDLAQNGADILLHYRKEKDQALQAAEQIKKMGRKVWIYQADLAEPDSLSAMLEHIRQEHESLDIYIANAASTSFKPLNNLEWHHIQKTLNLVIGSFIMTTKGLTPLLQNRNAHIVTISGIDTVKTFPGHGLLACAKSALETLTKYFAAELAPLKIYVNSINPGFVSTDSTRFYLGDNFDRVTKALDRMAPVKGVGTPADVAKIVSFLCSDESNWLTGQTLYADGGLAAVIPV